LVNHMILQSPTNLTPEQESQIALAGAQIESLNDMVLDARERLADVQDQLEVTNDVEEATRLRAERDTLINQINQAAATVATFSGTVASLQQRTNSLEIVERARVGTPTGTGVLTITLLGVIVGAGLGIGGALLIEYMRDTIGSSGEATQLLNLPILGVISRFGKQSENYQKRLIANMPSSSAVAESYRTLRTNLMYSSNGSGPKKLFIVTSAGPSEGKSVTAANLAVSMTYAGMQVLLIDADLRRPRVHEIFGLNNDVGLTSLTMMLDSHLYFQPLQEARLNQ
jgi:hypothetical protein